MHYCGMCGVDLNLQLSLGCRRLLDPLPIVDLANQTYLHSLLTVLTDAECYEGELSGDGTLCFGCANSLEQLEHLQRQVRQKCKCCGSVMFISNPIFSHPGSRIHIFSIPDPWSASKNYSILTPKNCL
jgi:hypothetical protein